MTENELRKIFDEVNAEFKANLDVNALAKEFVKKFNSIDSPKDAGLLVGDVLAVLFKLNQDYFFRVLSKVLCKP